MSMEMSIFIGVLGLLGGAVGHARFRRNPYRLPGYGQAALAFILGAIVGATAGACVQACLNLGIADSIDAVVFGGLGAVTAERQLNEMLYGRISRNPILEFASVVATVAIGVTGGLLSNGFMPLGAKQFLGDSLALVALAGGALALWLTDRLLATLDAKRDAYRRRLEQEMEEEYDQRTSGE